MTKLFTTIAVALVVASVNVASAADTPEARQAWAAGATACLKQQKVWTADVAKQQGCYVTEDDRIYCSHGVKEATSYIDGCSRKGNEVAAAAQAPKRKRGM